MRWTVSILLGTTLAVGTATAGRAAGPSRTLDDFVVLGIERVRLKDGAQVLSGDVGVNDPVGLGLMLGRGGTFADGTSAVADAMRADRVTVYDLYTNALFAPASSVVVRGAGPLATGPLPLIAPLPALPTFAPGTARVVVDGALALSPGAYGDVVVPNGTRLELAAGTYELRSLQTGRNAVVLALGAVVVDIEGTLRTGNGSTTGPGDPSLTAQDVVFTVGGGVAAFGSGATAQLQLYAPHARLTFGRAFRGIGQFVGRTVNTDHSTVWSRGDCGNAIVEPREGCDPPDGVTCDASCLPLGAVTTTTTTSTTEPTTTTEPATSSTTLTTSTTTTVPFPTTTTTTMPVALCGNRELDEGEECDPPGAACPPDGVCGDDCVCLFGGGS